MGLLKQTDRPGTGIRQIIIKSTTMLKSLPVSYREAFFMSKIGIAVYQSVTYDEN